MSTEIPTDNFAETSEEIIAEPTPAPPEKTGRKKRRAITIVLILVTVLLVVATAATGLLVYQRNQEAALLSAGYAALSAGDYEAAIESFNQALAVQPEQVRQYDDEAILARAQAYLGLGEPEAAIEDLNHLLALDPNRTDLLLLRATAYLDLDDREAALADYETVITQDPDRAEPYLYRGLDHLHFRRDADALADLTAAIERDGALAEAFVNRGLVHFLNNDIIEARADAQAAIEAKPNLVLAQALLGATSARTGDGMVGLDALNHAVSRAADDETAARLIYLRARVHLDNGQTAPALSDAEQVVALAPGWSWGYLLRGDVHLARDEGPQASFDYQQAVDLDPESGIVYVGRAAGYLHAEDLGAAGADLSTALSLLPDHVPAIMLRARVSTANGDADAALADLDTVLELDPTADAYALRADLYFEQERWDEARADYDQALAANPDDLAALSRRARAAFAQEDYAAAITDLDAAIALAPTDVDLIALRAETYLALDNLELAYRDAQRALTLDADQPIPQMIEGMFQYEQERYFQAVIDLTDAIDLDPESARAFAARAHAHFDLHDPDRARADAARALELDPESAQAHLARALVYVYERDWSSALSDADRAVELAPDDELVLVTRGLIYLEGGDANAALDDFEQSLEMEPEWVDGRVWRAAALDQLQRYDDAVTALQSVLEIAIDVGEVELAESGIADLERIPEAVDGNRTWRDVYHEFDITYPADWRQYVDPGEVAPLLLMGPLDKDYRASLVLTIFEIDYYLAPSKLAKLYGPGANDLPDYELLSERTIRVDGNAAARRTFTWTAVDERLRDVPVTVTQVYAYVDEQVLIFTATTRTEGADKHESIFDAIINSFDFN
ncbi:MAG: tetratricopeptide repeat protein [Chloroflexi bacterium]|nr:tetratricopeptide repeat protein [Chloroflexota bacterium]